MSNIGKTVLITGMHSSYLGRKGVITSENSDYYVVELSNGHKITPYRETHPYAECKLVEELEEVEVNQVSMIGRSVKIVDCAGFPEQFKKYSGQIGTIIEDINENFYVVHMPDEEVIFPYRENHEVWPQCILLPEVKIDMPVLDYIDSILNKIKKLQNEELPK